MIDALEAVIRKFFLDAARGNLTDADGWLHDDDSNWGFRPKELAEALAAVVVKRLTDERGAERVLTYAREKYPEYQWASNVTDKGWLELTITLPNGRRHTVVSSDGYSASMPIILVDWARNGTEAG